MCGLVDRKILDHRPGWWDDETLEYEREWCGVEAGTCFTVWNDLAKLEDPDRALRHGGILGFDRWEGSRGYDYVSVRKVLAECLLSGADAVLIMRDLDAEEERAPSIRQAAAPFAEDLVVLLALPKEKREAWMLNGFVPQKPSEEAALAAMRQELGFCPVQRPEELRARKKGATRNAKRVVKALMPAHDRQARCWEETPWGVLRANGIGSGLAVFLEDVRERLIPLVTCERPARD